MGVLKMSEDKIPKVYFFGMSDGLAIKIGFTTDLLSVRKKSILHGQMTKVDLHLLAAVNGTRTQEKEIHNFFLHLKDDVNSTEQFKVAPELIEYINWLRQQWWTYLAEEEVVDEKPAWPQWMPTGCDRRVPFMEEDPYDLIPRHVSYHGPLAGTCWNRLSTPTKSGDDFYTPKEIVDAARNAMGGIDLDPASHWQANRVHKIPKYYHLSRSAHDNPWFGRVWLNPPYGNNAPWFECIKKYWDAKEVEQLCMISPVWVFNTQQAIPIMDRSSAMVILTPTPEFWGHPNGRTGVNHPHAVIYLGHRAKEFRDAFRDYGMPFRPFKEDNTA
jgi:hypothetical protein